MRAVVQRVSRASVRVAGNVTGAISYGLLVLAGFGQGDTPEDVDTVADKIPHLRVFDDADGHLNLSVLDTGGQVLVVSQFTLYGDCRKGRRPSFQEALAPEAAEPLYERFVGRLRESGLHVETGRFRETMDVELTNAGPVTLLLDSRKQF